jgi:hypothetical protein
VTFEIACVGCGRESTLSKEDRADLGSVECETDASCDLNEMDGKEGREVDNVCGVEWPEDADRRGVLPMITGVEVRMLMLINSVFDRSRYGWSFRVMQWRAYQAVPQARVRSKMIVYGCVYNDERVKSDEEI